MSPIVEPRSKGGFNLGDYVEVKDRIRLFYEAFPSGAIVTEAAWVSVDDDVPRIWVRAAAYRAPDDPHPGIGHSWMILPGTTSYTKGSELENTETSAWGRAIGATGIALDKSVASADEVRNKEGQTDRAQPKDPDRGLRNFENGGPDRPELERRADGLIGTVVKGANPADLELRYDTDNIAFWGFKLKAGKTGYQAFATGPLAETLHTASLVTPLEGETVTVWGKVETVPFFKGDKELQYARIVIERLATSDWILPATDTVTVPMFAEELA